MCGIIGYTGTSKTADILIDGLKMLEYRGYDSAGIAFHSGEKIEIIKYPGRVDQLKDLAKGVKATCGIGHTRWATHGSVSYKNTHPHQSGKVTLVHNGIIENYKTLIEEYGLQGEMKSSGDTEVAAILLNRFYNGNPYEAIGKLVEVIKGTYALTILFSDRLNEIYAIRKISPIVFTTTEKEAVLASDLMPLARFSKQYFILPENTVLKMTPGTFETRTLEGKVIKPVSETMDWEVGQMDLMGYSTFMEKEISQQPDVVYDTMVNRIRDSKPCFESDGIDDDFLAKTKEIVIVACGTSYHAGLAGKYYLEKYAGIRTSVYLASEFIYSPVITETDAMVFAVSQSGETIDTLQAVNMAKEAGLKSLGIVNVRGSSIALACDKVMFTNAGPEIAVASTKAYTCQLTLLYLLACRIALLHGKDEKMIMGMIRELQEVPQALNDVIKRRKEFAQISEGIKQAQSLFMIGRGLDYYALMEGTLKMKEISYIHAESYASGELKHGPLALISEGVPVIAAVTQENLLVKEASNIKEVRARKAEVFVLIKKAYADRLMQKVPVYLLPDLADDLMIFPCIAALQLISYYAAVYRDLNVDKPRNLAKVVTVE